MKVKRTVYWLFSTSPETSVDSSLKIFFFCFVFLLLNSWTSSACGKWSKWGRVCVVFSLAERVSSVCKDSARHWWGPHSSSDIWEALSVKPADSKRGGKMVLMVLGEDGDLNHSEPQRTAPTTHHHLHWPKQTWHNDVNGCWVESQNCCLNCWINFMWCLDSHTSNVNVLCRSLHHIM